MKTDTLIFSHDERKKKIKDKRDIILGFMRDETYTIGLVLMELLGFKNIQNVNSTLKKMEKDNLVKRASIDVTYGRPITLWGITETGIHYAFGLDEPFQPRPSFSPSKVKPITLQHRIDLQLVHVRAINAGWTDWIPGHLMGKRVAGMKLPDAVAINPRGEKIAIELERTCKSRKRYAEILVSHLMEKKVGQWQKIYYLCPTEDFAARVRRAYFAVETAKHKGTTFTVKDEHRAPFYFYSFSNNDWL